MMNTIRKIALLLLFSGFFSGVSAQRIYQSQNGKVFFALTAASGMPVGAITTVSKYTGTYIPDNQKFLVNQEFADSENARVFQHFQIASTDLDAGKITWGEAYAECRKLGPGWRLPTQRELMIIGIFKEGVDAFLGSTFASGGYWSITEHNGGGNAWSVILDSGRTDSSDKTTPMRARCVREVK